MKPKLRKHLSVPALLKRVHSQFQKIKDPIKAKTKFSLIDCLMSGVALFGMKYPSLLQFDEAARSQDRIRHNLKSLYQVNLAPSDTYFRERLDSLSASQLQPAINRIIAQLQRAKILENFRFMDEYYLVSIDGTGYFSSHEIFCESCCVKNHRDGTKTYYHQMLAAVLVHPELRTVLPLMLEPIVKQDGATKNDCEHSALKRLLQNLKRAHPHLKLLVTLDGLYADGVIIKLLKQLKIKFIITALPSDLKYLYEFYHASKKECLQERSEKIYSHYEWKEKLPINDVHYECEVNLLCYEEMVEKKKKTVRQKFSWITDLPLSKNKVALIMRGGRARWKIENETFNTLKNQGYQFEHNFGHGKHQLSVVMAYLMFIAFLIDQVQEYCCKYFQAALKRVKRLSRLWERMRGLFIHYWVDSWDDLYTAIIEDKSANLRDIINTS